MYSLINPTDLEQKLFRRTFHEFAHPEFISWVPTEWLLEIANPEYLSTTTKHRDGDDGDRVTLDELYEILLHDGLPWIATNDFQENGLAVIDLLLPDIHRTT